MSARGRRWARRDSGGGAAGRQSYQRRRAWPIKAIRPQDSKTPRGTVPPVVQLCRAQSIFRLDGGPSGQEEHTGRPIGHAMGFVHEFDAASSGPPQVVPNADVEGANGRLRSVLRAAFLRIERLLPRRSVLSGRNTVVVARRRTPATLKAVTVHAPRRRLLGKSRLRSQRPARRYWRAAPAAPSNSRCGAIAAPRNRAGHTKAPG